MFGRASLTKLIQVQYLFFPKFLRFRSCSRPHTERTNIRRVGFYLRKRCTEHLSISFVLNWLILAHDGRIHIFLHFCHSSYFYSRLQLRQVMAKFLF